MSDQGIAIVGQFRHFTRPPFTSRYAGWYYVSCDKFRWFGHHAFFYHGWTDYELHRYPPYWYDNRNLEHTILYFFADNKFPF